VSSPMRALHFGPPQPTAFAAPTGPAQLPQPALRASCARDSPCAFRPRDIGHRRIWPCRSRLGFAIPVASASPVPLTARFGFAARTSRPRPRPRPCWHPCLGRARAAIRAQPPRLSPHCRLRFDRSRTTVRKPPRRTAIPRGVEGETREEGGEGGEGSRAAIRVWGSEWRERRGARGREWKERREVREGRAAASPSACGEVSGGRDGCGEALY
jgi:hypothetical protein